MVDNIISLFMDPIRHAMANVQGAILGNSLAEMPDAVKQFEVNGQVGTDGGIQSLSMLVARLQRTLNTRSASARALFDDLTKQVEALELVVKDLNAREDDNARVAGGLLKSVATRAKSQPQPAATPSAPSITPQVKQASIDE